MKKAIGLVMALVLTMFASTALSEQFTFTFQQGVNGYAGTRDTHLDEAGGGTSYGSDTYMAVDAHYGGSLRNDALLVFDGIFGSGADQIPDGAEILSATLRIYIPPPGSGTCGATLHRMLRPWNESDTWDIWGDGEYPHNSVGGIQADGTEAVADPDDEVGTVTEGTYVDFDVTDSLQAWSDGAANCGWVFLPKPISVDGWRISTHEEPILQYRPELTVIPEPATLSLLALGGLVMVRKRRR